LWWQAVSYIFQPDSFIQGKWSMKKVPVENIEDAMVLARDVSATSGNILLGKGTKLNTAMGRRLKNWGIFIVYVEGEEEATNAVEADGQSSEEIHQKLEEKFSSVMSNPAMQKIFDVVYQFRVAKGR
jgi:hypothetical protein